MLGEEEKIAKPMIPLLHSDPSLTPSRQNSFAQRLCHTLSPPNWRLQIWAVNKQEDPLIHFSGEHQVRSPAWVITMGACVHVCGCTCTRTPGAGAEAHVCMCMGEYAHGDQGLVLSHTCACVWVNMHMETRG